MAIQLKRSSFTDIQKQSNWLGYAPALLTDIEIVENRLGVKLPKDYKDLLLITNGFFTPCDSTEPTFEAISRIDYLKNIDTYLLEIWNEGVLAEVGEMLNRAIVIGGMDDEQFFFLFLQLAPKTGNVGNLRTGFPAKKGIRIWTSTLLQSWISWKAFLKNKKNKKSPSLARE